MAVTHVTATRNAISDAVLTEIGNSGQLTLRTSGDAEIATLTLPATSGTVGATDLTFGTFTDDTNATGGTTDRFDAEDSNNTDVFMGSVGTSGEDINLCRYRSGCKTGTSLM